MKRAGAIGAAIISLSACASQKLTQDKCVIEPLSGFINTTGNQQRITIARNGSPCVIGLDSRQMGIGGTIPVQPAHGTASIRTTPEATLITYTPAHDYVGDDRFEVVFSKDFNLTVLAHVVPLPAN